jgi:hypothetical protein
MNDQFDPTDYGIPESPRSDPSTDSSSSVKSRSPTPRTPVHRIRASGYGRQLRIQHENFARARAEEVVLEGERAAMQQNDPQFLADLEREARERQAMWWEDPRFYENVKSNFEGTEDDIVTISFQHIKFRQTADAVNRM